MKAIKILFITLISIFAILNSGCKCTRHDSGSDEMAAFENDTMEYPQDTEEFLIPSPTEVLEVVLTSDIKFSSKLLAKTGLEEKTLMGKHKALLLGVYVSDFAYVNIFNQREVGTQYFNSIQTLTKDLGISSILNDAYYKRFDSNMNNFDSIDVIFKDFSSNAFNTLTQSGNREMLSMISIGSIMEILYLGVKSINLSSDNQDVISKIEEHRAIFDNYYGNFMMFNKNKQEYNDLSEDLGKIQTFFKDKLDSGNKTIVTSDSKNHFVVKDESTLQISKKELLYLSETIESIRTKILEMKY